MSGKVFLTREKHALSVFEILSRRRSCFCYKKGIYWLSISNYK